MPHIKGMSKIVYQVTIETTDPETETDDELAGNLEFVILEAYASGDPLAVKVKVLERTDTP
jgi:hypothetical protein